MAVLLFVHVLPIWTVSYLPTQDGPAHIYNGKIFFESFDRTNYQVRLHYDFGYQLFPNILTHLMLGGLQQVLPPLIAEKIVVSLIIALVPLSLLYLLNAIEPGRGVMCLIGFTFAYHNLFHIGFYNFSLSVSLCLFTIGWWWRYKDKLTLPRLGVFYALSLLTYLSHFVGFMAVVMTIGIASAWIILLRTLKAIGRFRRGEVKADFKRIVRWGFGVLAVMLPLLAAGWDYNFRNYSSDREQYQTMAQLKEVFESTLTLMSYSEWHLKLTPFVLWATAGAAALTALHRLFRLQVLKERDALLLVCGALAYLYFVLPYGRNDGGWVNDRLYIIGFLLLWAWFGRFHRWLNPVVAVVLIAISLAHTGRLAIDYRGMQPALREIAAAVDKIDPHSTVAWDLKADIRPPGYEDGVKLVTPWLHALSYYGMAKDVVLFSNYEAGFPYFLTRWGEARRRDPDYIVALGAADAQERARKFLPRYDIIHESPKLVLLRAKKSPLDLPAWTTLSDGRRALRLRMRGGDSPGICAVPRDRQFASGSFGWVREAPRQEFPSQREKGGEFPFLIGDTRDRAFRIDLPNGRYEVTCHFVPNRAGSYQTHVIANDRRVGNATVADPAPELPPGMSPESSPAPPEVWPETLRYAIDITDGHLTQVFYTTRKGSPDRRRVRAWAISGIEVVEVQPPASTQPSGD